MKKITLLFISITLLAFGFINGQTPPDNDSCSGTPEVLSVGTPGVCNYAIVSLVNATNSGFADSDCPSGGEVDLWYTFTMPASEAVRVQTSIISSTNNTAMSAYAGTDCGSLTFIGCNDDIANGDGVSLYSRLEIFETQGTTIYIRVWDVESNTGSFNLCASEIDLAPNDDCDSPATTLETDSIYIVASNSGTDSTNNTDYGSCSSTYSGGDIWFTVETPSSGHFSIETSSDDGTVTDTVIAIYSGTCPSGLTFIECNDDNGPDTFSVLELNNQTPGQIFYIRAWSLNDEEKGTFKIRANELPTLGTDDVLAHTFKMYPNPTKDVVNLKFNHTHNSKIDVTIYNIHGKLVKTFSKILDGYPLDVSSLYSGIYFVRVNDGINELTKKLIIK